MAWATPEQVKAITGDDVTVEQIAQGEMQISIKTGLIPEQVPTLAGRDAYWLRLATAYQTVWAAEHPDLYSRLDVTSTGQDGQSASFDPNGLVLAPLAKHTLRRLSFRGTRSTTAAPAGASPVDDDDVDAYGRPLNWRPL
jgi:hypothetical protein